MALEITDSNYEELVAQGGRATLVPQPRERGGASALS